MKNSKTDERNALAVTDELISDAAKDVLEKTWEKTEYFLNGEMLLWKDRSGRWKPIKAGVAIGDGLYVSESSINNYPKDPHLITLDNGITAKALGNPLLPQAVPFSADENDDEAAKKVTSFLLAHRTRCNEDRLCGCGGVSMREQVIDWLKITGNVFIKDVFDASLGDELSEGLRRGEIRSEVVSPYYMLVPQGIDSMARLPWIGEKRALPIGEISRRYGRQVPEESLVDLKRSQYSSSEEGKLKKHAIVYEFYFAPAEDNGYLGRKIVRTKDVVLFDGVYDKMLANSEYCRTDWHPYSHVGWRRTPGKFWAKTLFEDLVPLQIKLNQQWKRLLENDKSIKGWWVSQEGDVDWDRVRTSSDDDGIPNIQYNGSGRQIPFYQAAPPKNTEAINEIQLIISRMNDIVAQYETTRGADSSNITSGKQAEIMNQSSNTQSTPILTAIVGVFMAHWKKVLHLAAVHYEEAGREIRYKDIEDDEEYQQVIFKPQDIRCDDIVLFGGNAFFSTPEAKKQELREMAQLGLFGDFRNNPADRKAFLRLYDSPTADSMSQDELADVQAARRENRKFAQYDFVEDREWIITAVKDRYLQQLQVWLAEKNAYDATRDVAEEEQAKYSRMFPVWQRAEDEYREKLHNKQQDAIDPGPPPIPPTAAKNPGSPPQEPVMFRYAQEFEDHATHIKIHRTFRKSAEYERLCRGNAMLAQALDFHESSHIAMMIAEAQKQRGIAAQINPPAATPPPVGGTQAKQKPQ